MPDKKEANELILEAKMEKMKNEAQHLYERYRPQMDLLESDSLLVKAKGRLEPWDVWSLGKQLEAFEIYKKIMEENGSLAQLGTIPNIAFDVITVAYGTSIIPFIASVQPIEKWAMAA